MQTFINAVACVPVFDTNAVTTVPVDAKSYNLSSTVSIQTSPKFFLAIIILDYL